MSAPIGRVAIMQPYLYPYAGYFRLLAASDLFIILDDVQFPRRGRVHRCELPGRGGAVRWLTLPLARQPVDTRIRDLAFAPDARARLDERLRAFPILDRPATALGRRVCDHLQGPLQDVAGFLEQGVRLVAEGLKLQARIIRSSGIPVAPGLHAQSRIIALIRQVGGGSYINAPGGAELYRKGDFDHAGVELLFLPPYTGAHRHLLPGLMTHSASALRDDILSTCAAPSIDPVS